MGFWNKLGKIGLSAAPYIAAPFTGGASLALAPAANKAVGAWNQKDAQKNAAKGLAPSRTDQFIGMAGNMAGGFGGGGGGFKDFFKGGLGPGGGIWERNPGYGGGIPGMTPPYFPTNQGGGGNWQQMLGSIFNQFDQRGQGQAQPRGGQPIAGSRALPNMNLQTPNLANPMLQGINQGRAGRGMPPVSPQQYTGYNW
jgi:hypothetical protein